MAKYYVTIHESYSKTFEVEADSYAAAYDKASNMYWGWEVSPAVPVHGAELIDGGIVAVDLVEENPSE